MEQAVVVSQFDSRMHENNNEKDIACTSNGAVNNYVNVRLIAIKYSV